MESPRIVVFDGDCGLCNGFVAWLVRHDRAALHLLAGSGGKAGRAVVRRAGLSPEITASTIILWNGERAILRSDAVIDIVSALGWPWRGARILRWVPRGLRDAIYAQAARRRPRIEGDPVCGVPPRELAQEWRRRLASVEDAAA
ncbi:thiol-disulfide oxidoreductase DCC family protein [Demequina sp. NBRC 110052]|uniref:thiol-disulfide oxidoreductase DCC family protein n=1 Tax=Demequina sp. NBRC 110052 TaxID=1570341 RepID=UPI0009FCB976|nr:DCC1-like thiol-disulfide oxidoreductase family protein [Demequina sp. NBRC 110052]